MPKKANIFESFSHSAIQQFKEAFGIMDTDKDGLLSASDLVAAFGAHGKSIGSGDAQVRRYFNKNFTFFSDGKIIATLISYHWKDQPNCPQIDNFNVEENKQLFGVRVK